MKQLIRTENELYRVLEKDEKLADKFMEGIGEGEWVSGFNYNPDINVITDSKGRVRYWFDAGAPVWKIKWIMFKEWVKAKYRIIIKYWYQHQNTPNHETI